MTNTIIPNGCFTVSNKIKSTHKTVKIHTVRRGKLEGKRIISLLVGSDNNNNYSGFGFVNDNGTINIWNKYKNERVKTWLANFISKEFSGQKNENPDIELLVEKKCIRCNRRLTTPESIKSGIGPECIKRSPALPHTQTLIETQENLGLI